MQKSSNRGRWVNKVGLFNECFQTHRLRFDALKHHINYFSAFHTKTFWSFHSEFRKLRPPAEPTVSAAGHKNVNEEGQHRAGGGARSVLQPN